MNPLLLIRVLPYVIGAMLIFAALMSCFKKGQDSVQAEWDKAKAQQVAAQLAKNQADSLKLKTLEETKNANMAQIDKLHADNHALWLRIPKTDCVGSGQASANSAAGTGELPTKSESDLAEAKRQLDDEAFRADQIVEQCRVLNGM